MKQFVALFMIHRRNSQRAAADGFDHGPVCTAEFARVARRQIDGHIIIIFDGK